MIYSYVVWPIIAALWGAFGYIGAPSIKDVRAANMVQEIFLERYMQDKSALTNFSPDELRTWASDDAAVLNGILKKEGFEIQLQPFNKQEFGVISILDVMMKWLNEGTKTSILVEGNGAVPASYDAFELKDGFAVGKLEGYVHPIITIKTKNEDGSLGKDQVHITIADEALSGDEVWKKVLKLRALERSDVTEYTHAVVPMIDYDQSFKLDWLLNLNVNGWFISQALQQTKFKMNEKGARVKSAVAIAMMRSMMPMPSNKLIIDKPFYLWIEREGVPYPIFAGYLDQQFWHDPKDLEL